MDTDDLASSMSTRASVVATGNACGTMRGSGGVFILGSDHSQQYAITVAHMLKDATAINFVRKGTDDSETFSQSFRVDQAHAQPFATDDPVVFFKITEGDRLWNIGGELDLFTEDQIKRVTATFANMASGQTAFGHTPKVVGRTMEICANHIHGDSGALVVGVANKDTSVGLVGVVCSGVRGAQNANMLSIVTSPLGLEKYRATPLSDRPGIGVTGAPDNSSAAGDNAAGSNVVRTQSPWKPPREYVPPLWPQ